MKPEDLATLDALRQTIAALNATIVSQAETITFLKWLLVALGGTIASLSGFFVAWIRALYDSRQTQNAKDLEDRDKLLERVLTACNTLATAVQALRPGRPT
jgi:hypothetical protein